MESRRATGPGVTVAWVWAVMIAMATLAIGVAFNSRYGLGVDAITNMLAAVVYAALGLLMAIRQPGNRVAWLFFVVATWVVLNGAADFRLGDGSLPPSPVEVWDVLAIAWGNTGYLAGFLIPLFLLFYIFPTGRFLNRRWSWAGWTAGVVAPMALFVGVFPKEIGDDMANWTVANPIGFLNVDTKLEGGVVGAIFAIGFLALGFGGIPAIIARYRRSDAQVRAQIKWVVFGLLILATSVMVSSILPDSSGWVSSLLFLVLLFAAPVSITLAITRFQLYEIDRLISRTVAYVLVVGTLGLVYAFGAVWLPGQLLGEQPPLFVAASTLAAAALFNPTRRRILSWVDNRFNRSRYDAQIVIEDFTSKLRGTTDPHRLAEDLVAVLHRTLQPSAVGVSIRRERDS